ncbi:MAG TPA: SRPBCC family protein [Baekduia sp.]|nr:SRPBCC family protein [Baekduia sp.]
MAHYTASLETPRPPAATFAYLSDFSTTQEWDPGVVEAQRLGDDPVGHGTEFRVVADFLGRKAALTYRIVEFEPDRAVTLRGENATVVSLDRITFEPSDGGTRVTYDADLALKGPLRIADPLLGLAFDRVGDRALEGLRAALGSRDPVRLPPLSGRSLDGRHHDLPGDLRTQHTFVVAAFRREQQALVDQWLPWLVDLEERRPDVTVYELPILSSVYSPGRCLIDGGMARGVGTDAARARTITVYTDVGKAVRELGLRGTDTIGVLLVDRSGHILAREHGGFDDEKAARLTAALERSPSRSGNG